MSIPVNDLPHGWRRPHLMEYQLREQFPELEFVCRRFKSQHDGLHYMSIKATISNEPGKLRFHRYISFDELWRGDAWSLLIAQLWLVSPR